MKTLLIAHARNAIHFLLLIALLSIAGEMGRPYAYAALREREHDQLCERMGVLRTKIAMSPLRKADEPDLEPMPSGCVKKTE